MTAQPHLFLTAVLVTSGTAVGQSFSLDTNIPAGGVLPSISQQVIGGRVRVTLSGGRGTETGSAIAVSRVGQARPVRTEIGGRAVALPRTFSHRRTSAIVRLTWHQPCHRPSIVTVGVRRRARFSPGSGWGAPTVPSHGRWHDARPAQPQVDALGATLPQGTWPRRRLRTWPGWLSPMCLH